MPLKPIRRRNNNGLYSISASFNRQGSVAGQWVDFLAGNATKDNPTGSPRASYDQERLHPAKIQRRLNNNNRITGA